MKKLLSLIIVLLLVFLCSCGKKEPVQPVNVTADMLSINDTAETYLGCVARYKAVAAPMSAVVNILEAQNNEIIRQQDETDYFKNERYILTSFDPLELKYFSFTESFDEEMTAERAKNEFSASSGGKNISFEGKDEKYLLSFVSEGLTEKCSAEYDKSTDSLRYVYSEEDVNGERVIEFLEFCKTSDGVYLIQTMKSRACLMFDEENRISYFCCSELKEGDYSENTGIYPSPELTAETAESWALELDLSCYESIHTYKDNIMTHKDCSSGPWKSVEINAMGYASALFS